MQNRVEKYVTGILKEVPDAKKEYVSTFLNEFLKDKKKQRAVRRDPASFREIIVTAADTGIEEAVFALISNKDNPVTHWSALKGLVLHLGAKKDKTKIVVDWVSQPENHYAREHLVGLTELIRELDAKELEAKLGQITAALKEGKEPNFSALARRRMTLK